MRRTARRRFVRHVCLRNLFLPFLFGNFKLPLDTRSRFLRAAAPSTSCIMVASCPFLRCIFRKRPVQCREARGLVTELWSPRFVTIQWLCSQSFCVTAANQWTLVEIELLATVGWKWGCQPFSRPCSENVMRRRTEICSTCLFKESIPSIPFGNSKLPLSTRSRFLRAAAHSTRYAFRFHHAHSFAASSEKRSVQCREAECLVTELWSPRFVTIQWLCSQLCNVTGANQWTTVINCRHWAFSNSGLEVWLPAF